MNSVNERDVEWVEKAHEPTRFRRRQLGKAAGSERLGCSLYELPPGSQSWPYHYHEANEEALYVLSGTGTVRTPEGDQPLESGDYVAFLEGEDGAHTVANSGEDTLRYLMLSTMTEPDISVYPDLGTFGIFAGGAPGADTETRTLSGYYRREDTVEYWTGKKHEG